MSELRINNITDRAGSSGPIIAGVSTVTSTSHMVMPSGPAVMRGGRGRGVLCGGYYPTATNIMDFVEIATTGNATDFGDLINHNRLMASLSSSVRGIIGGGYSPSNVIQYTNISSSGGMNDFGDLFRRTEFGNAGASNNTRGLFLSGYYTLNRIDFITIATLGDSADFGNMSSRYYGNACSSPTRAVFAGGNDPTAASPNNAKNTQFVEIATLGDAQEFGELSEVRRAMFACASSTRGIFAGGLNPADIDTIEFITIATKGNTTDFGNLTEAKHNYGAGTSSQTRGIFGGTEKYSPQTYNNTIEFITIATTGNASDFGDITQSRGQNGDFSDVHGGIGD